MSDIGKRSQNAGSPCGRAPTDDVILRTVSADLLERLKRTLASLPAADSQRVAEIRTAIDNGSYRIDANVIAGAMMQFD